MFERTLPSGIKVIVDPSHGARVVAAQVWVGVGSADELPHEAGLAHVHEHMLFKGTARRRVGEIAQDVEAAGGDINAYTSFDQTVYHVTIASRELDVALDILADAVQHSAFDPDELERELEVVLEELRRGQDNPARVAGELLFAQAFRNHPYGRPIIGYVETVESLTREQVLAFYRKWYHPQNMVLVVAGDVDAEDVIRKAEALFPVLSRHELPERPRAPEPPQKGVRCADKRMDIQEAHVSLAWTGPALAHPDTPALDVLTVILGVGESSRLYRKVKRERQLVTDCYAYAYTPKEPGLIGVSAQLQARPLAEVIPALLKEALALGFVPPSASELAKAKTIVLSDAVYALQTVQGRARKLGYFEMVGGGVDFEVGYREAVSRVSAEDVVRVAQTWLHPDRLTAAVVLPEEAEDALDARILEAWWAQARTELESEFGRSTPPSSLVARGIETLGLGVSRTCLGNGATVFVQPDPSVPLVSIMAVAQGGLLDEDASRAGASHLVGELLARGTERYSAEEIAETCDAMAGAVSGQSGRNSLGLRGEFLKESWLAGFDVFASCLLEPTFEPAELELERQNALDDLAARSDQPGAVAFDAFAQALYDDHPYARPAIGTRESLSRITRDQVVDAYRTQLRPDRLTIAVVGDVSVPETLALIERRLGGANGFSEGRAFVRPEAPRELEGIRTVEVQRDKAQAQLVFGFLGLAMDDERRYALEVLTQVLGGQSGRLFLELRDRRSLAYSVGCFGLEGIDRGYLALHIGTHPDKLSVAEEGMREELRKLCRDPVDDDELRKAQRYLVGSYEIGLQRAASRATTMALNAAYGLGYDAHAKHAAAVEAVTAGDVLEVARELIDLDRMARAVVGPSSVLAKKAV